MLSCDAHAAKFSIGSFCRIGTTKKGIGPTYSSKVSASIGNLGRHFLLNMLLLLLEIVLTFCERTPCQVVYKKSLQLIKSVEIMSSKFSFHINLMCAMQEMGGGG
jgi:adenylosuccinate synthase